MKITVQKWGNSAAIRLPVTMLSQLGVAIGDAFEVDVGKRAATLRVSKPKYKLADLIAQCDPKAPLPDDLIAWNEMQDVGAEIL